MAVEVTSLVWQLLEATAYKAYKNFHLVGLKKASAIICFLCEKRRLKNCIILTAMIRTDLIGHFDRSDRSDSRRYPFIWIWNGIVILQTCQERPKSAPYLRLIKSKTTSKCQEKVISELWKPYIGTLKKLFSEKVAQCRKKSKGENKWETLYPGFVISGLR